MKTVIFVLYNIILYSYFLTLSTAVFQQFSKDPITQQIPIPIIGTFQPGDEQSVIDFKDEISHITQSAQGTNTYEAMNTVFEDGGLFDNLPSV